MKFKKLTALALAALWAAAPVLAAPVRTGSTKTINDQRAADIFRGEPASPAAAPATAARPASPATAPAKPAKPAAPVKPNAPAKPVSPAKPAAAAPKTGLPQTTEAVQPKAGPGQAAKGQKPAGETPKPATKTKKPATAVPKAAAAKPAVKSATSAATGIIGKITKKTKTKKKKKEKKAKKKKETKKTKSKGGEAADTRYKKVPESAPFLPAKKVAGIIKTAKKQIGVPYRFGGTTPDGFDCSGFLQYVFKKNGFDLPRTADEQYKVGKRTLKKSELTAGDLVFFTTYEPGASHCGIYLGDDRFIHASSSRGIRIDSLSDEYWRPRYYGGKHIVKD